MKNKKNTSFTKSLLLVLSFFLISLLITYNNSEGFLDGDKGKLNPVSNTLELTDKLKVHFIDVGQGDAIFIELPNKQNMLIDAGEASQEKIVENYLKKYQISTINYLIGTHPHADHIGGLSYIINNFKIEKIYMPKALSTSKTYENLLKTIAEKELKVSTAKAGVNIIDENDLKINILAPNKTNYESLNNHSAVIKIIYKNNAFLFMGDAETISEKEITEDLSADLVKVAHHGSNTSSSKEFVNKVNAKYAIIMVGADNKYNHPSSNIITRWQTNGAKIYRTDLHGNIIAISDGKTIEITTSK